MAMENLTRIVACLWVLDYSKKVEFPNGDVARALDFHVK